MLLMLLGAFVELLTIGAVIPFLALAADPSALDTIPRLGQAVAALGLDASDNLTRIAAISLAVLAVTSAAIRLTLTHLSQRLVFGLGHDVSTLIYKRLLRQPYSYYVQRNTSELIAGIEKVDVVVSGVFLPLMHAVTSTVIASFIIALLFAVDPLVATTASFSMALIYVAVSLAWRGRLHEAGHTMATRRTGRVKLVQEGLGGIRDIVIDRSHHIFEAKFRELDREYRGAQATHAFIGAAPRFVVEGAGIILLAGLAYYMSLQPGGLIAAIPVLGALALGAQRLLPLLQVAYVGWSQFAGYRHIMGDVAGLITAPVSRTVAPTGEVVPWRRDIVLGGLLFRYGDGVAAVKNVDLLIRKGQKIGFVGRTGSGKSTLIDIIMGLLEPSEGEIRIDGDALTDANRANWQAQIAHVPQHIYLTDSSIASNIAFGCRDEQIDMGRVRRAARSARIDDFVDGLPDGYHTSVGERGIRLSGGQRQRIGIARALYKNANVLVFDEATSALDNETEASVMAAVAALGPDITVLMIAHRLTTVSGCDRIVRIDDGAIVADGPFEEVVAGDMAALH
ncbi:MAG: ABC transporter ATP-binding protein [Sphingomicrobium sp.]